MKTKFTPGPWFIDREDSGIIREIGPCVAEEYAGSSWIEVSDDDAHLIAAAPDLYNALETLTAYCEINGIPTDAAYAALAKARGEAQ